MGSWGNIVIASLTKFFPVSEGGLILSATHPLQELDLAPGSWRDEIRAAVDPIEVGVVHGRFPGLNTLLGGVFNLKKWLRRRYRPAVVTVNRGSESAKPAVDLGLYSPRPVVAARWIAHSVCQSRIVENRRRNYAALASSLLRIDGAHSLCPDLPDDATPYVPAFLMAGQQFTRLGRIDEARDAFRRGIEAADQQGDTHAFEELKRFWSELG